MKKLLYYTLIALVATSVFSSCSKNNSNADVTPIFFQVLVIDGRATNAPTNATVSLYLSMTDVNNNNPKYTQTANLGTASFVIENAGQYFIVATNGSAKSYYSGLIPIGIFQTQSDIQTSPAQSPAAVIGGIKYQDINGDGIINNSDKVDAPSVNIVKGINAVKSVFVY